MSIEKQILSILLNLADERELFFTDHRVLNLNGHSHELFTEKEFQDVYSTIKGLFHEAAAVTKHSVIGKNNRLNKSLVDDIDNEPLISGQIQTLLDILIENYRKRKIRDIAMNGVLEDGKSDLQFDYIIGELSKLKTKTTRTQTQDFVDKSMDWVEGLQNKTSWRMVSSIYLPELRELVYAFGGALYAGMYGIEGLRQSTKTMLCINLMLSAAQNLQKTNGGKILFYSLDDSFDQFMVKCVSIMTGMNRNIFLKKLDNETLKRVCDCVMNSISILPFEVITRKDIFKNGERITWPAVASHIRRKAEKEKVEIICMDYVQKFQTCSTYRNKLDLYEGVCDGSRAIQEDFECAFFLLSQQTQLSDDAGIKKKIESSTTSDSNSKGNRGFPDAVDVHIKMMNLSKIKVDNENAKMHKIRMAIVKNKITGIDDKVIDINFIKDVCKYE